MSDVFQRIASPESAWLCEKTAFLPHPLCVTVFYLAKQRYIKQTAKTIPIRYAIQSQEKSLRSPLWRTTLGGGNNDALSSTLDDTFRNNRMAGAQHRLLDRHGRGCSHRHYHEHCILENAPEKNKHHLDKAKRHCPIPVWVLDSGAFLFFMLHHIERTVCYWKYTAY